MNVIDLKFGDKVKAVTDRRRLAELHIPDSISGMVGEVVRVRTSGYDVMFGKIGVFFNYRHDLLEVR